MNFIPNIKALLASAVVTLAVGPILINSFAPPVAGYTAFSMQQSKPQSPVPTFEIWRAVDVQTAKGTDYKPTSSWYKNKHWWKRNAPVVGGAAGGALIGGLAGGGKGAIIGGAVGGGGGYLYKRLRHHHDHHNNDRAYRRSH